MHEASIIQNVLDLACERMPADRRTQIVRIRLRVGALAGVVPDALTFAFEAMKLDTPAHGAALEIEHIPARLHCPTCQRDFMPDLCPAPCPECGNWDVQVRAGGELDLLSVEFTQED
jgi:hydrogenase nickel incorporation protein HypA/HybF